MTENLKISIAIFISEERLRAEKCLQSVLAQDGIERVEILLFDLAGEKFLPIEGSSHPCVRRIFKNQSADSRALRMEAVQNARGDAIAFVDDHTFVLPGWLDSLIRDFDGPYAGVGAAPIFINSEGTISEILDLMSFADFHGIREKQETAILPGHNPAYRRDALLSLGNDLANMLPFEMLLDQKLHERGHKLLTDPAVRFVHLNVESAFDLFQVCYLKDRGLGAVRAHLNHWSIWRKSLQIIAIPVVPFIRLMKIIRLVQHSDPEKIKAVIRHLWVFLICQLCAAAGQAAGCTLGEGSSNLQFTQYELNKLRFMPHEADPAMKNREMLLAKQRTDEKHHDQPN